MHNRDGRFIQHLRPPDGQFLLYTGLALDETDGRLFAFNDAPKERLHGWFLFLRICCLFILVFS